MTRRLPDDPPDSPWRALHDDDEPGRYVWDDAAGLHMARCPQCGRTLIVWRVTSLERIDGFQVRPHLRNAGAGGACSGSGLLLHPDDVRPVQ